MKGQLSIYYVSDDLHRLFVYSSYPHHIETMIASVFRKETEKLFALKAHSGRDEAVWMQLKTNSRSLLVFFQEIININL